MHLYRESARSKKLQGCAGFYVSCPYSSNVKLLSQPLEVSKTETRVQAGDHDKNLKINTFVQVTLTIGSETSGSILSPSQYNAVAGIKPTVGLVSRSGVVPLSASQDTAGYVRVGHIRVFVPFCLFVVFATNRKAEADCHVLEQDTAE